MSEKPLKCIAKQYILMCACSPCMRACTQLGKIRADITKANTNVPGGGESVF